jgi:hypothetical protein
MTICDVLDMEILEDGTKGMDNGKLYWTLTFTRFPELLQGRDDGVQADPVVGQVVVAVRFADAMPGKLRFRT